MRLDQKAQQVTGNETVDIFSVANHFLIQCVNALTPKWSIKLAGYDVYIGDQCYAMEQSLRIDEP